MRFVIGFLLERREWPTYRLRPILDSLVGLLNFMEVVIHALQPFKHWVIGLRRAASKHEVFTLNDTHLDLLQSILQLGLSRNESQIWCREDELARLHVHVHDEGFGGWGRSDDGRSSISMASGANWWGYRIISSSLTRNTSPTRWR